VLFTRTLVNQRPSLTTLFLKILCFDLLKKLPPHGLNPAARGGEAERAGDKQCGSASSSVGLQVMPMQLKASF
jgi:hypothetical protein